MEAADTAAGDPPDPDRLRRAVHGSAAAEVATATDGRPQTFPLCPFYDPDRETVVVTSPPAFAGKVDAVSEHPQLSLLFYQADEPFVLRGRGTVRDDDLEANAAYVGELVQTEPDSPKTEGFSGTAATLESRLGRPARLSPLSLAHPGPGRARATALPRAVSPGGRRRGLRARKQLQDAE